MRTIVCGGRAFADYVMLDRVLSELEITVVIEGGARGADSLARRWAQQHGIPVETYPADWESFPRSAGMIRNQRMLAVGNPGQVVAFPGGAGTDHMVWLATRAGVPVHDRRDATTPDAQEEPA